MKFTYNVYDEEVEGALILKEKNHKELCDFFQIHSFNHAPYTAEGRLYRDRYRIERVKDDKPEKATNTPVDNDFEREWNEACKRFQNCIWVKQYEEGVRCLVSRKQRKAGIR